MGRLCRTARAVVFLAAGLASSGARAGQSCDGTTEQVIAYSLSTDQYVVALHTSDAAGDMRGLLVRRLSTDEPVEFHDCDPRRASVLTDRLGLRACWFTSVHDMAIPEGFALERPARGGARWRLRARVDGQPQTVLTLPAHGTLSLRALVRAGEVLVAIISERYQEPGCLRRLERAIVIAPPAAPVTSLEMPAEPDTGGLHPAGPAPGRDVLAALAMEATAAAWISPPAAIGAARIAAVQYLDDLAACWLVHSTTVMSTNQRQSFWRGLLPDAVLGRFAVGEHGRRGGR